MINIDSPVIALLGNPNTGKSTLFNSLTGLRQHTGNWPGKTVTRARGFFNYHKQEFTVIDLPGTYSLQANSTEEIIARDFISQGRPDVTIVVADATNLERNLNLLLQVTEITDHVILCLNLMDEARRKKINIDIKGLENDLHIPVIPTVARDGRGLEELKKTVYELVNGNLEIEPYRVIHSRMDLQDQIVEDIYKVAERIAGRNIRIEGKTDKLGDKIDDILTSKWLGFPIMLLLLGIVFWITIAGANIPSRLLGNLLFGIEDYLNGLLNLLNAPEWLTGILVSGVYRTMAWVVSVMLPPMAIFFPIFTLLEDLGYLPRVAFNLDNFFKRVGAHGKQSLTMSMGFGCNAAGVIAARIIESPRERLIAILTNNFVPCNGRFPTLIILASIFVGGGSLVATGVVVGLVLFGIMITLIVSWGLSRTILKGVPSSFTLELPPYRRPRIGQVLIRSFLDRTLFVLGRAVLVAAPAGVLVWLFANTGINGISLIRYIADILDPFALLIGLDGIILLAFILGLPANEIVIPIILMSYLSTGAMLEPDSTEALKEILVNNGWTRVTALSTMLFSLLHFPCGTTLLTIKKETSGIKWPVLAFFLTTTIAIAVNLLFVQIIRLF